MAPNRGRHPSRPADDGGERPGGGGGGGGADHETMLLSFSRSLSTPGPPGRRWSIFLLPFWVKLSISNHNGAVVGLGFGGGCWTAF